MINIVLLMAFTACSSSKQLSENEAVCNISGENFDAKNIRVCLAWSDMWNGLTTVLRAAHLKNKVTTSGIYLQPIQVPQAFI